MQAIAASDAMEYAIRKAVELGVSAVQPVTTARSAPLPAGARATSAARGGISPSPPASNAAATAARRRTRRFPSTNGCVRGRHGDGHRARAGRRTIARARCRRRPSLDILIGPEGGFTADEIAGATRAGLIPVRLGPRVLRTETAGPAALAAAHALWGDFR